MLMTYCVGGPHYSTIPSQMETLWKKHSSLSDKVKYIVLVNYLLLMKGMTKLSEHGKYIQEYTCVRV